MQLGTSPSRFTRPLPKRLVRARSAVHVRSQQDSNKQEPPEQIQNATKVQQVLQELKQSGWDRDRATTALAKWNKLGVRQDPEQLRKLLVKSSLKPLGAVALQFLLDVGACAGGFLTAFVTSQGPSFSGDIAVEYIGYAIGLYYFLQVLLEGFALTTIVVAVYRFNANPSAYLAAVEELAGPKSKVSVVDRVQAAVNTAKVFTTLGEIADLLKEASEADPPSPTTLKNLSAYLTLIRAREVFGFNPDVYGLNEKEAGDIAVVFSEFDLNDDGKLELSEIRRLCNVLGKDLNDDELREAITMLDTNKNGYIEFNEFVGWWTSDKSAQKPSES